MFVTMSHDEARSYFERALTAEDADPGLAQIHIASRLNVQPIEVLLGDIISVDAQRAFLPYHWAMGSDYPSMYAGTDTWVKLFERTGFVSDFDDVSRPDAPTVIYRGVTGRQSYLARGMSWTLDLDKARWFAHRLDQLTHPRYEGKHVIEPTVWQAVAPPKAVLALFYMQDEQEVVVNPRRLRQVHILETSEPQLTEEEVARGWEAQADLERVLQMRAS